MSVLSQDSGQDRGQIVATDPGRPAVPGRPPDDTIISEEIRYLIEIEVRPDERVGYAAGADVFLGLVMVAGEGEGRIRGGTLKGEVDDPADARGPCRVDGVRMEPPALAWLGVARDDEGGLDPAKGGGELDGSA